MSKTKGAKAAVYKVKFKMKVVGAKKGKGSYKRKPRNKEVFT